MGIVKSDKLIYLDTKCFGMTKGFKGITKDGSQIEFTPHYEIETLKSITEVRQIMPNPDDPNYDWMYELNWLFLSTSGVHGTYITLDEIEETWDLDEEDDANYGRYITILIVHPRICVIRYGNLEIQKNDIPYLRECVEKTIKAVKDSQKGNILK